MEQRKVILFYDLCRLCLENAGVDDMFTKADLVEDILLCTGVNVTSQENLPRKICGKCLEIVVNARQLRDLAMANDRHLSSLFDDGDSIIVGFNKNQCESAPKKLTVRKDLFDSSVAVISSTKDDKSEAEVKQQLKVKMKRIKTESGDSFNYVCDVCHKEFNAWKKYYLHQKTHNRSIFCPLDGCGKKFATKGDLEKHVRTHTGEKPFKCDLCDKRFAQRGSLKSHKATVHSPNDTSDDHT
ncbi:myoneurin isoform X3 [Helicoverpa armigera]|uniref:myoneurin isoform X3 n=1 Tax=Helicoverpa armigera TaxID=29058 RepID=UPI0030836B89